MTVRFFPLRRIFAFSPRCGMRPFGGPFHRPWISNLTPIDKQIVSMQREMDKMLGNLSRFDPWHHDSTFKSDPLYSDATITDINGTKHINYNFDLHSFKPDEISIKTKDGGKTLEVHAVYENNTEGQTVIKREFHQVISIPETVKSGELQSVLSPEGVLTISAPLNEPIEEVKKQEAIRTEDVKMDILHE